MNAAAASTADALHDTACESLHERLTERPPERPPERPHVSAVDQLPPAPLRLRIEGLHCAACAGIIEAALRQVPGVVDVRVQASLARLSVRRVSVEVDVASLADRLRPLGYRLAAEPAGGPADAANGRRREQRLALWRLFVAGFCMMQVMMLAAPLYLAAPGEIPPDQRSLLAWGSWVLSLPVLLFSARPFFASALRQLRARRIGMDLPVALAIAVGFVASSGAAVDPGGVFGHELWFDSLTMFVFLLLGARWLEQRARHRVAETLEGSLERLPSQVQRLDAAGRPAPASPDALRPGDRVRVAVGEAFAADGVLLQGRTRADEALLSGESTPCAKKPRDAVVAGSLNLDAPVLMRVERVGADTRYQAIVALMHEALEQRPRLLRSADRVAAGMLAGVLLLAAAGAAAWSFIDPSRAIWVAVSVLVVTCPCALSLAAPSALLVAAGSLARRGVLVQRLDALEALARLQQLFVDKTGTLTEDRLEFGGVVDVGGRALEAEAAQAVRLQAASLASWSQHPLARSLAEQVGDAGAVPGEAWTGIEELAGQGLRARDASGIEWRLGSHAWLGLEAEPSPLPCLWFGTPGAAVHGLRFQERLRPDAAEAIKALQADGVRVTLLSGDQPGRVAAMAQRLGITQAFGAMTPAGKRAALAAVQAAQAGGGIVGMVGDGLNDAPVLAQADVSIAMGQGALVARRKADLVLMSMRLGDVLVARRLARRCLRVVHQNFAGSLLYNALCIPLALAGALPPWLAGAGMAASSIAVMLNALRLRHD